MAYLSNPASVLAPWTAALASALVLGTMLPRPAAAQTTPTKRSPIPEQTSPDKAVDNGKYYALVIGINTYPSPLPSLKTAENDAQAIAKFLHDDYGFEVKLLLGQDAKRNSIVGLLNQYEALQANDNLVIYYAGHGYENKTTGKAYWLAADADSTFSPNRIIADDITSEMAAIPARHILVISDSCYSGGLAKDREPNVIPFSTGHENFLRRMLDSKSRTLMASGGDEPVSDVGTAGHSVFTYALLQGLAGMEEGVFTAKTLFNRFLEEPVGGNSQQLPEYDFIRSSGHVEGDFVFIRRGYAASGLTTTLNILSANRPADRPKAGSSFDQANAFYLAEKYEQAFPLMTAACESNDMRGCGPEGDMYLYGRGVGQDTAKGLSLSKKGCDNGDAHSCSILGNMYSYGYQVPINNAQAVALYRKACDGGDAFGCWVLARHYEHGLGVPQDPVQTLIFYRKACDRGDVDVCLNITGNKGQAAELYRKGCDGGDAASCNRLGVSYHRGDGVIADDIQAAVLFRKACDGGYAAGCMYLGEMYQDGIGVAPDKVRAAALHREGCDGGIVASCIDLGVMYESGTGVTQDKSHAAELYRKGCDRDDAIACSYLGTMYAGAGVTLDNAQAVALFQKGCDRGDAFGCSSLGVMYENGAGVTQDKLRASALYKKGCDGGNADACKNLKRLQP